jgi:ribosomal protein S19
MAPRSSWKIAHVSNKLTEQLSQNHFFSDSFDQSSLYTDRRYASTQSNTFYVDRSSTITPDILGSKVSIHNGVAFRTLKIRKGHLGLRYGEFAYTRAPVKHKIVVAKKSPTKK